MLIFESSLKDTSHRTDVWNMENKPSRSVRRVSLRRIIPRFVAASLVSIVGITVFTIEDLGANGPRPVAVQVAGVTELRPGPLQQQITSLVNGVRSTQGLSPLVEDPELDRVAMSWAQRLATMGRLEHTSDLSDGMSDNWLKLGENIGRGGSIEAVHAAWVSSEAHLANITDPKFDSIGVGVVEDDGTLWLVQRFRQTTPNVAPGYSKPTDPSAPAQMPAKPKKARKAKAKSK